MNGPGQSHGRAHICSSGYELRVTRRCLEKDLGENPEDCKFERLCRSHPIVKAFRDRRSETPSGTSTVGPSADDMTITVLRHTSDHRGATWHDKDSGVVWLLASRGHRSGSANDAFPYFQELISADAIYPTARDYEDLTEERSDQFVERAIIAIPELVIEARACEGTEVSIEIGAEPVSCLVHIVETAEERFLAVSGYVDVLAIELLKQLIASDCGPEEWRTESCLPTRELDHTRAEVCFSVLTGDGT